jgi:copper(I)-binding protein
VGVHPSARGVSERSAGARLAAAVCAAGAALAFAAPAAGADIRLANAWTRPMGQGYPTAEAYVDIRSDVAVKLVGASSAAAKSVAIMVARENPDGTRAATAVRELEVPAERETRLALYGNHLELREIQEQKTPGMSVPLKLEFVDSAGKKQIVEIDAVVRGVVLRPPPPAEPQKPQASANEPPPAPAAAPPK